MIMGHFNIYLCLKHLLEVRKVQVGSVGSIDLLVALYREKPIDPVFMRLNFA